MLAGVSWHPSHTPIIGKLGKFLILTEASWVWKRLSTRAYTGSCSRECLICLTFVRESSLFKSLVSLFQGQYAPGCRIPYSPIALILFQGQYYAPGCRIPYSPIALMYSPIALILFQGQYAPGCRIPYSPIALILFQGQYAPGCRIPYSPIALILFQGQYAPLDVESPIVQSH